MNHELAQPIQIKEYLPQPDGRFAPIETSIPVELITDSKIAAFPFKERAQAVTKLAAYSIPFLKEAFDISLEEVRPETLALATVIHDLEVKEWEASYYTALRSKARATYEAEKREIRGGKRGGKGIEKKLDTASQVFQAGNSELTAKIKVSEVLKNTILDDFVIQTLLTPGGAETFLLAVADLQEQSYITERQVSGLLQAAQERLKTMDPSSARELRYKDFMGNLVTVEQAAPLSHLAKIAFSQNGTDVKHRLSETAFSLLDFYWKNSRTIIHPGDKTPKISIFYDVLTAVSVTKDPNLFKSAIEYFDRKFSTDSQTLGEEFIISTKLHDEELREIERIFKDLQSTMTFVWEDGREEIGKEMTTAEFMNAYFSIEERARKLDPRVIGGKYGIHLDRSIAFYSFSTLSEALGLGNNFRSFLSRLSFAHTRQLANSYKKAGDFTSEYMYNVDHEFPETISLTDLLLKFVDKKTDFSKHSRALSGDPATLPDTRARQQYVIVDPKPTSDELSKYGDLEAYIGVVRKRKLLYSLFVDSGIEGLENLLDVTSENQRLTKLIRDKNLWFVAEQGDQFSAVKNPELKDLSIQSITFYPEPDYMGNKVSILTDIKNPDGTNMKSEFTLTRDGELRIEGSRIGIPYWLEAATANLLLKRLHFITSGVLGERGGHVILEDYEPGQETEVRRSHWRILTSTGGRRYTLNSPQAQTHAEFVKETYGIDIYEENLRRRIAGTLKPDQVLTFVKAVKGSAEPNQLVYNEALLNLETAA